jgi:hypothetical protein
MNPDRVREIAHLIEDLGQRPVYDDCPACRAEAEECNACPVCSVVAGAPCVDLNSNQRIRPHFARLLEPKEDS